MAERCVGVTVTPLREDVYGHARRLQWIASWCEPGDRILDLGCGTGFMVTLPLLLAGHDVVGVDPDPSSIDAGRDILAARGLDPSKLHSGNIDHVEGLFEVIVISEVLEHLTPLECHALLRSARARLVTGGRLLVTVPNGYGSFEFESALWYGARLGSVLERLRIDRAIRLVLRRSDDGYEHPSTLDETRHRQRFSLRKVRRSLARAGLTVVESTGTTLVAGPFSNLLVGDSPGALRLNGSIGRRIPAVAAGFMLVCRATGSQADDRDDEQADSERRTLLVLKNAHERPEARPGETVVGFDEFRSMIVPKNVHSLALHYDEARLLTYDLRTLGRLLPTALALRWMSRGACEMAGEDGGTVQVTPTYLARLALDFVRDRAAARGLTAGVGRALVDLGPRGSLVPRLELGASPLYLRTDFAFGLRSGGSVGHIAGVLNNLHRHAGPAIFITNDRIPTVNENIETYVVPPGPRFRDFGELWSAAYNEHLLPRARSFLVGRRPAFVYQRYSHNNYCGLALAHENDVPFVLEYNGSEVWMARNWGSPLTHEALALDVEMANLRGADLIVVVSEAMRDELATRGVDPGKILVNPNGVDPDVYRPDIDGGEARARHGLEGKTVIGFIGTFGRWHGAEVLADAFGRLLATRPDLRSTVRLLMIGNGVTMPEVRANLQRHGVSEEAVLTGTIPQEQGPSYLAACDILVSPHVPNPDGTPFFGSPTKLFEYMAMGRGIVASALDQIGEVLQNDRTALLVEPGDPAALADGISTLIEDPHRAARLGRDARAAVVEHHTWAGHTARIVDRLIEVAS